MEYIYIFFILFGPKIGTYIDTSILANICVIFILTRKENYTIVIDARVKRLLEGLAAILVYSILISIVNTHIDVVFYGRMVRTLCSICGLWVFISKSGCSKTRIEEVLTNILIIHAIVIIISAVFYTDMQERLRWFTAYDKHVRQYRSTGLMAGFDMAGLLCNIGIVLVLIRKEFNIVRYVIFSIAVMFTSRFSLVSYIVLTSIYLLLMRNSSILIIKKVVLLATLIPIALFGLCVFSLTTTNTLLSGNASWISTHFPQIYNWAYNVDDAFARSDGQFVFNQQFQLSSDLFELLFGKGVYGGGDPGYTRFINAIGITGIIAVFIWHIRLLNTILKTKSTIEENSIKKFKLLCFSLIIIGLNFKNSYFFTGTFFEVMLLMLFPYLLDDSNKISDSEATICKKYP